MVSPFAFPGLWSLVPLTTLFYTARPCQPGGRALRFDYHADHNEHRARLLSIQPQSSSADFPELAAR
jgi:hypothetical protein